VIVGDKNNVHAKPSIPVLAFKPATRVAAATAATGGSATARAVLENPRGTEKAEQPVSRQPNLSSSGRRETEVDFFAMLNQEPPKDFKYGADASLREELLEVAELSFAEVLKLGPSGDAQTEKGGPTTVKGKRAELEKLFNATAYSTKPIPGSPYSALRNPRLADTPGKSVSSTAIRSGASTRDKSGTWSTAASATSTTSTTSTTSAATAATARGDGVGAALPPIPGAPRAQSRPRSGSQPISFSDLDASPQGRGPSRAPKIIPARSDYSAPRVTSTTSKLTSTTAGLSNVSSVVPATDEQSRKIAADAELRRLATIAKSAHITATSTAAETNTSTTRGLAKVARRSDPKVCFENPPPPGWKSPSLVVYSGSWFVSTQRYTQIGSRAGSSDKVLPAYESFVPGAPAEVTGDGKWSELMINFQRSAGVMNGAGKTSLSDAAAKEIFRGNPKILWNGTEISVYEPMSRFVAEQLRTSSFFGYVRLVQNGIHDVNATQRVKLAADIAESFCSDNLLAKIPQELVNELIHLDCEVIKWALDSGCPPSDIAAVRRDVAIVFLVTKGTTALMTQGDGDTKDASAATSGSVLMQFGGLVAKAMKAVMSFPNSGKALSERILKKSLEQMISAPSLAPDWKERLEKLKEYEIAQPRISNFLENASPVTTAASSTATTISSSATLTAAPQGSSPGNKSNPKRAIRRAGTAGKMLMPPGADDLSVNPRTEKKRLLNDLYATPWFKNRSDKLKKAIRGAVRELDAKQLTSDMVTERAEKCAADYQAKKSLIKELRGDAWFKDLPLDLGAAIVGALDELDADGLSFETVEKAAKEYVSAYGLKSQLLARFYAAPAFQSMSEQLKRKIRGALEEMDADGLTEGKVEAAAKKFANDLISQWGRKTPQTSPEKASEDASEVSSLQSQSESEGESGASSPQSPSEGEKADEKKKRS
jgi:hypothetical protein